MIQTDWEFIAGEDATLLYMYRCRSCGTVVIDDYSDEQSVSLDADFCPICEPQATIPFVLFWSRSQIRNVPGMKEYIESCKKIGMVL